MERGKRKGKKIKRVRGRGEGRKGVKKGEG